MHLKRFDLNLLVALNALLEERSVTRAAERVHVSQPAMSGALQRLRENFNDQLLVRVGRQMELTPRARDLVEPVREILLAIDSHLRSDAVFEPASAHREFAICMTDFVSAVLLPKVMQTLSAEAPGITLHVEPLTADALSRLESAGLDFAIRATIEPFRMSQPQSLVSEQLFSDDWVCVAAADHPTVGDAITVEEYLELPHVALSFGKSASTMEEVALRHMSIDIDVRATARSFSTVYFMLQGTELIGLLPRRMAVHLSRYGPCKILEMPFDIGTLSESLFWHERNDGDPAHTWLRGVLKGAAETV
jgi:LysR family transcriptional regulator, nod-box dependent transcriptional activator